MRTGNGGYFLFGPSTMNKTLVRCSNGAPKWGDLECKNEEVTLPNGNIGTFEHKRPGCRRYVELTQDHQFVFSREWDNGWATQRDTEREIAWLPYGAERVRETRLDGLGRLHGFTWYYDDTGWLPRTIDHLRVSGTVHGVTRLLLGWAFRGKHCSLSEYQSRLPQSEQLSSVVCVSIAKRICRFL